MTSTGSLSDGETEIGVLGSRWVRGGGYRELGEKGTKRCFIRGCWEGAAFHNLLV